MVAWESDAASLIRAGIREQSAREFCEWRKNVILQQLVQQLETETIRAMFWDDEDYPSMLKESSDPPEQLFIRGHLPVNQLAVAVVGTRRATSYGRRCVERIVPALARDGFVIVSGLALGIDTLAHEACLDAGGTTVAFIGAGIDEASVYPRANLRLAHGIIASGGALVSEYPSRSDSRKEHFPVRNRLIAGYSSATVVVEAAQKSGSLITARIALEENREVLAVPGPIMNETSQGTHALLRAGAKLCESSVDVVAALALDQPEAMKAARDELSLTPDERKMVGHLHEPMTADGLSERLAISISELTVRLSLMEMKGLVKRMEGNRWSKSH